MLCRKVIITNIINNNRVQLFRKNSTSTVQTKEKWDVMCGVCLERKPGISRSLNEIEKKFMKMLNEIENENSMKSEHEIRHEIDHKRAEEFKKGKISTEDVDKSLGQTASEFEDSSNTEISEFEPASRTTEADEKNDQKSTERKLDRHLLFIVNENIGNSNKLWLLPEDKVQENETLRESAERVIREKCGSKIVAKFYGNSPCGFYKYKYPAATIEKTNVAGAKIFFMKAEYVKGDIDESKTDYNWATRKELPERFINSYYKSVTSFLIDDEEPEIN